MTRATPLVSVVIPCYNQAHFLADAAASARATSARVEIVVVDDGSADDTSATAASLSGVRVIRQENAGVASARNRGLSAAQGEFIVFLDADDRLLPNAIDAGVRALAAHPDAAFAFGGCVMMDAAGVILPTPERPRIRTDVHQALLVSNPVWTPAVAMFRRDALLHAGGFRAGFDAAADYDLYLRLTARHDAVDHGEVVAAYRRHGSNMSDQASRMLRETLAVLRAHRPSDPRLLPAWRAGLRQWQDFYGTQLTEEIRAHLRHREVARAARKAWTLARLAPAIATRELRRKARVVRYAGRAMPAAEISSAITRADTSSGS